MCVHTMFRPRSTKKENYKIHFCSKIIGLSIYIIALALIIIERKQ